MRRGRDCSGFTLLEVAIASGIFAIIIAMTMMLLRNAMSTAEMDIIQTNVENQVQNAVDDIVKELKETSPSLYTSFDFLEGGYSQTAMCFPTARSQANGQFTYKIGTAVQQQPVWQGVEVICYVKNPNGNDGWLYKYVDYNARSYTNAISVKSITSTQITLQLSDGTTTAVISRLGALGANQKRTPIPGRFIQAMTQGNSPIQLTIRSTVRHQTAQLTESNVITTLTNEALSRNHN